MFIEQQVEQEGDFLEVTDTYEYTETVVESVEQSTSTTTTNVTSVTTTNLVPSAQYTDTNINVVGPQGNTYGMNGAEFTTGNQQQGGGRRIYSRSFNEENKQQVEYGVTVHSHASNAYVPACANVTTDCRDDWSVTVRLYSNDVLVDTLTHSYTGINWVGTRDYSWTEDVSGMTFDYGTLEFFGIDRGYYGGYYGPGFSDPYVNLTYNVIEEIVQTVVSYVEMQTVLTTEVFVYDSIYNPQIEVTNVTIDTISETQLEVIVEAESYDIEIVEVFEIELEVVDELEIDMPVMDYENEDVEVLEVEIADNNVEAEPEAAEPEVADVSRETPPEETDQGEEEVETVADSEPTDEDKEEAPRPVAEVKKKPSQYSPVLDSVKVALMVRNEADRAFTSYRKETIPDVPFYSPVSLDGGEVVDNMYGRWMTGASDLLWEKMVDSQWQK